MFAAPPKFVCDGQHSSVVILSSPLDNQLHQSEDIQTSQTGQIRDFRGVAMPSDQPARRGRSHGPTSPPPSSPRHRVSKKRILFAEDDQSISNDPSVALKDRGKRPTSTEEQIAQKRATTAQKRSIYFFLIDTP